MLSKSRIFPLLNRGRTYKTRYVSSNSNPPFFLTIDKENMETEALNGQGISYLEEGEGMLFVHYIGQWTPRDS